MRLRRHTHTSARALTCAAPTTQSRQPHPRRSKQCSRTGLPGPNTQQTGTGPPSPHFPELGPGTNSTDKPYKVTCHRLHLRLPGQAPPSTKATGRLLRCGSLLTANGTAGLRPHSGRIAAGAPRTFKGINMIYIYFLFYLFIWGGCIYFEENSVFCLNSFELLLVTFQVK